MSGTAPATTANQLPTGDKHYVISVTPLIQLVAGGFAIFNVLVGVGLFLLKANVHLLTTNSILTTKVWGIVFFTIGTLMFYALATKRNPLMRRLMLSGIFIKAAWLTALLAEITHGTFFTILMWGLILFLQILFYTYFFTDQQRPL